MRRGLLVAGALALGFGVSVVLADEGGKSGADKVGRGQRRPEAPAITRLRSPIETMRIGPVRPTKKHPRLSDPRKRGELVHRRDQKGG